MIRNLKRRDFTKLSMAALGGAMAGTVLSGCNDAESARTAKSAPGESNNLISEPHVCRGLNTCKSNGACKTASNDCKGKNACAGQGKCASAKAHTCKGSNDCKGQGGCEDIAGQNACEGKGACAVPLSEKTWAKARPAFEAAMTKAGKKFGKAPAAP